MTSASTVQLWDVFNEKCCVSTQIDCLHMGKYDDFDGIDVTENGTIVVITNIGLVYAFDMKMQAWQCIADSRTPQSPFVSVLSGLSTGGFTPSLNADNNFTVSAIRASHLASRVPFLIAILICIYVCSFLFLSSSLTQ